MAAKKKTQNKKNTKKSPEKNGLLDEILILLGCGFCLILFLSMFGVCGAFGKYASMLFFGLFGLVGYLFPILVGAMLVLKGVFGENRSVLSMNICLGVLYLCLCGMVQILLIGNDDTRLTWFFTSSMADHFSGGFIGAVLVRFFCMVVGETGAYILFVLIITIALVMLTRRSILKPLKSSGETMVSTARQRRQDHKDERAREARARNRQQTHQELRQSRPVAEHSVDFNMTDLKQGEDDNSSRQTNVETYHIPATSGRRGKGITATLPAETPMDDTLRNKAEDTFQIHGLTASDNEADKEPVPSSADELMAAEAEKAEKAPREKAKKLSPKEKHAMDQEILSEIREGEDKTAVYEFPPFKLLNKGSSRGNGVSDKELKATAVKLEDTLRSFGVNVSVNNCSCGPAVTRYELEPEPGVKVSRITNLADDIKLNLAVADIRIEAPIPGKAAVGIEVPNETNSAVYLRGILESEEFQNAPSALSFAVGKDIAGKNVIADLAKMPHLLIAGATGSGKSVCINTLIMSILYKARPDEVKLIMIDPKVVELSVYNGIPHLMIPVVTDPKKASGALNWAVAEMTLRYQKFAESGVRDVASYNKLIEMDKDETKTPMPKIVVIVDELADLMMVASSDVEDAICRLAQLARAAGIHLVIATQRPSVNVITGLIKANMPSRIAFAVSSGVDSRTILDMNGAEKLLGKGDMLFDPQGYPKPARIQGCFVTDKEVNDVVDFLKSGTTPVEYDDTVIQQIDSGAGFAELSAGGDSDRDVLFAEAGRFIIEKDKASIGMLQRMFKIGFNRAARIMDQLCEAGAVSGEEGTKARKILMTMEEFEQLLKELG